MPGRRRFGFGCAIGLLAALGDRAVAARAGEPCTVGGRPTALAVTVAPRGAPPIELVLHDVPVSVRLPPGPGAAARVTVSDAIALDGRARAPALFLAHTTDIMGGLVRLSPSVALSSPSAAGGGVEITARIAPESTTGASLRVTLPCEDLTLTAPSRGASPAAGDTSDLVHAPRARVFSLQASPRGGPRVALTAESPASFRFVVEEETAAGWARVSRRWRDGSSVSGWLPASALRTESGYGEGTRPPADIRCSAAPPAGADTQRVTLASNATIWARPGKAPWATVRSGSVVIRTPAPTDEWVQVLEMSGVAQDRCGGWLRAAWARQSDVRRPAARD